MTVTVRYTNGETEVYRDASFTSQHNEHGVLISYEILPWIPGHEIPETLAWIINVPARGVQSIRRDS